MVLKDPDSRTCGLEKKQMTYYWSQPAAEAMGTLSNRWAKAAPTDRQVIAASSLLDPTSLLRVLGQVLEHYGTRELRPAASVWHKHYCATLLYPTLGAMLFSCTSLPAALDRTSIILSPAGFPERLLIHDQPGQPRDLKPVERTELHRRVWAEAFTWHLFPLITVLSQTTGVSRRTLWVNVGNLIADLLDTLDQRDEIQPASRDARAAFLESPSAPGWKDRNPLWRSVRYDLLPLPTGLEAVRRRNACCLRYQLAGTKACYTCPRLTPEERAQTLQAHRDGTL